MYINFGVLRYHSKANKKFRCMNNNDIIAGLVWVWLNLAAFGCVWMRLAAGFAWVWVNLAGVRYIRLGLAGFG